MTAPHLLPRCPRRGSPPLPSGGSGLRANHSRRACTTMAVMFGPSGREVYRSSVARMPLGSRKFIDTVPSSDSSSRRAMAADCTTFVAADIDAPYRVYARLDMYLQDCYPACQEHTRPVGGELAGRLWRTL